MGRKGIIMIKSKYYSDSHGEKILGNFLDRFLYKKLGIECFERHQSKDNQYLGLDVTFKRNGTMYLVDEKAALHYTKGLNSFALELHYKMKNDQKEGWLFDERKKTTHYLLAWPIRKEVDLKDLELNDILRVEVMLVSRQSLIQELQQQYNLTPDKIKNQVKHILREDDVSEMNEQLKEENIHHMRYSLSKQFREQPVNLVVNKEVYKSLAEFHFKIYRDQPYAQDTRKESVSWLR